MTEPSDELAQRMRAAGYELIELLGHGGMGRVWRAHERTLDRDVALKFLTETKEAATRQRFLAEARALARVQHPNVVTVYAFGEIDDQHYLAYELVEGEALDGWIGKLSWPRALAILIDLARGLAAVHEAGVLHRDLKPGNVMLTGSGQDGRSSASGQDVRAKLIDFGLAKILALEPSEPPAEPRETTWRITSDLSHDESAEHTVSMVVDVSALGLGPEASSTTRAGAIVGTPRYVAPEIWRGELANAKTEVYSLGLIGWELLTGTIAHADHRASSLVMAILDEALAPITSLAPGVPASLAALFDRAVSKDADARPSSAAALRDELEQLADSLHALRVLPEPIATHPDTPLEGDARRSALVRASLARVLADGQFGARFYARLFARHGELRPLFPADLRDQAAKLSDALRLAVALLRDPPALEQTLRELGRRHVLYGVVPIHLDHVRDTLVELLGEVEGAAMDAELLDAWVWTWGRFDHALRAGMLAASESQARPREPAPTRWAHCGATRVAFRSIGEARERERIERIDLIIVPSWFAHGEQAWRSPAYARALEGLAAFGRVSVFDRRGTGLSDRLEGPLALASALDEIAALVDALAAREVVLFGIQDGAILAERFAAREDPRVRGWIGWGTGPRGLPLARVAPLVAAIEREWGEPLFAELIAPSYARAPEFRREWSELLRASLTPASASAMLRFAATLEFGPELAPSGLLLHRRGDRWMPIAGARELAERGGVPLVELEGDDHLPWLGAVEPWITRVGAWLERAR